MFKTFKSNLEERISEDRDNGFSLLELIISVGILLLLTVGGIIGYSGITDNARMAALSAAASDVAYAAVLNNSDSDPSTTTQTAIDEWNSSSDVASYYVELVPEAESGVGVVIVRAVSPDTGMTVERIVMTPSS